MIKSYGIIFENVHTQPRILNDLIRNLSVLENLTQKAGLDIQIKDLYLSIHLTNFIEFFIERLLWGEETALPVQLY